MHVPSTHWILTGVACLAMLTGTGCEQLSNANGDCGTQVTGFQSAVAQEGTLNNDIDVDGPYPMAIAVSQNALNRLFSAVNDADLPAITIFDDTIVGIPVAVSLLPDIPLIQVGGERGCAECLLTEMGFGLSFDVAGSLVEGIGSGRYQFPLTLNPNGIENTDVLAQLGSSELLQIDLQVSGIDDSIMNVLEPIIADAATALIQNEYGDTELFQLNAWSMGNGDVRMLGRGPIIDPENETIVLGIHTNLVRPLANTIEVDSAIPNGADIGLQFHPELIQRMIQRMMFEGNMGRSYDMSGNADDSGSHQISLNSMQSAESELMRTSFRLWRTAGGFCGFADIQADMGLSISDQNLNFALNDIQVTGGEGIGQLLVAADSWGRSAFTGDLVNFTELTVNYNEFELPNNMMADMAAESFRLDLGANGLSLFLNIDNIVGIDDPATE